MKQGDTVEWTSSANGTTKTKRGTIVAVVPNLTSLSDLQKHTLAAILPNFAEYSHGGLYCYLARKEESYLVAVPSESGRGKPRLYWPRVSALRLVEDAEAGNA